MFCSIFWRDCFGGVIFHTGVMEPWRMGGFLGEKCCGHFSITKHQYPKNQLQWIVWGLWPSCVRSTFFVLISYYFGTLNRKKSCFLWTFVYFISHIVTSGGKKWLFIRCDLFMGTWLKWVFPRFCKAFCVKWPKTVKKFFMHPKIESFLCAPYADHYDPPIGEVSLGEMGVIWSAIKSYKVLFMLSVSDHAFIGWFKVCFKQPIGFVIAKV